MDKNDLPEFTTKSVTVRGCGVDMRTNNNNGAKAVILLHGIGVSEKYLRRFADEMSSRYDVISLTLPGYGETRKPPHVLTLEELTDVVAQFIRQENILHPVIIGQSMGCQIAARLGAMTDLLVDKLILISPTINNKERSAPVQFFRLLQDTLREPLAVNLILLSDYIKFGFLRYMIMQRYMIKDRIESWLAGCQQPTLLVRGGRDKIVPGKWIEFLRTTTPNGSSAEIESGPHNLQFTHPQDVANICIDFIEQ